jgi:integral membrane protein
MLKLLLAITVAEAISWTGLLGAMIAKYGFDNPRGVEIAGPVHGTLFLVFILVLAMTHVQQRWPIRKTMIAFLESIPPFTGFVLANQILSEIRQDDAAARKVDPAPSM